MSGGTRASPTTEQLVCGLYLENWSLARIAEHLSIDEAKVERILSRHAPRSKIKKTGRRPAWIPSSRTILAHASGLQGVADPDAAFALRIGDGKFS